MKTTDFVAIEHHIRRAHLERSAYLGEQLGNVLAKAWLAGVVGAGHLRNALSGARAGMDEYRRRRTVAAAHAAHAGH